MISNDFPKFSGKPSKINKQRLQANYSIHRPPLLGYSTPGTCWWCCKSAPNRRSETPRPRGLDEFAPTTPSSPRYKQPNTTSRQFQGLKAREMAFGKSECHGGWIKKNVVQFGNLHDLPHMYWCVFFFHVSGSFCWNCMKLHLTDSLKGVESRNHNLENEHCKVSLWLLVTNGISSEKPLIYFDSISRKTLAFGGGFMRPSIGRKNMAAWANAATIGRQDEDWRKITKNM